MFRTWFLGGILLMLSVALPAQPKPLVTGKAITPLGKHVNVGSFPVNGVLSPDGHYLIVSNAGFRQFLSAIRVSDGALVSQVEFNAPRKDGSDLKEGLYYGLAFGETKAGKTTLFASLGAQDAIAILTLDAGGVLQNTAKLLHNPAPTPDFKSPHHIAGIALSSDHSRLFAANNQTTLESKLKGSLSILDVAQDRVIAKVELPGFPYAVAAVTRGVFADKKVYVSSERDGVVSVVNPQTAQREKDIKTGEHPISLLLNRDQTRLYVANAGSDTISVIDVATDKTLRTFLVRPNIARGLAGATPIGLTLSLDEKRLFVTLADMNAVAILDLGHGELKGLLPTGWYPTCVQASPDGSNLLVVSAKGVMTRHPNGKPAGDGGKLGQYVLNILEGTVSHIGMPLEADLKRLSAQTLVNNRLTGAPPQSFMNPGIQHVIYIIKENRTYDQVLGDLPQGNGDASLCLFPRSVTPNLHALAERFVLLDNFYCCADVSADGWDWSVSGMISQYTARNAPYNYSNRGRDYDFEGTTNGVPVELKGIPDVARAPSGYFWDLCAKKGLSYRNYGFYVAFGANVVAGVPDETKAYLAQDNIPTKKALVKHTDLNFRRYDLTYADSDLWRIYNAPAPNQRKTYGKFDSTSRFTEWKREFDSFVKQGKLPQFSMMRLPRDHTSGTSAGAPSPRAMVADNDYAVGQVVEAVSKSPFWKTTAICVLEDDAQNGFDHVDAHRSIAFVISPYIRKGSIDSTFYNTDSMLRTMGLLLGLPPLCQYDAVANPIAVFGETPENDAPFEALLPSKEIATEINKKTAYRALDSKRLINAYKEESAPDHELNDILWGALKGKNTPRPAIRSNFGIFPVQEREEEEEEERRASASRKRKPVRNLHKKVR